MITGSRPREISRGCPINNVFLGISTALVFHARNNSVSLRLQTRETHPQKDKKMKSVPTYGQLGDYLRSKLGHDPKSQCDHSLQHTRRFAEEYGLDADALVDYLMSWIGWCDCEALIFMDMECPPGMAIDWSDLEEPDRSAVETGPYCHCLVDGEPASPEEAEEAEEADEDVKWWVPCDQDDPHAIPDLIRAVAGDLLPAE